LLVSLVSFDYPFFRSFLFSPLCSLFSTSLSVVLTVADIVCSQIASEPTPGTKNSNRGLKTAARTNPPSHHPKITATASESA